MRLAASADWHLRDDLPVCRNDVDWLEVQKKAITFVIDYANALKANVAITGDVFHRSHVHPSIVSMFEDALFNYDVDDGIIGILAGQHDLPYHNIDNMAKSSFGNVWKIAMSRKTHLRPMEDLGLAVHFGQLPTESYTGPKELIFIHQLTFKTEDDMPPTDEAMLADDLLELFPNAKWLFLGDNHHRFDYTYKGQHVINPGCLVRQSADLIDYTPGFYFVDTDSGSIEFVKVPDGGTVSNDHITKEQERDERIEAFVTSLEKGTEMSLDFVHNLRERMPSLAEGTKDVMNEMIEAIKA